MSTLYEALALDALNDLQRQPVSSAAYISAFRFVFGYACACGDWGKWRDEVLQLCGIDKNAYLNRAMLMNGAKLPALSPPCTDEWETAT